MLAIFILGFSSGLPLMLYVAFRRYLQAINVVWPVIVALVAANLVNVAANWILIHGRLGAPALGVTGAAYATVFSRLALAVSLLLVILRRERQRPSGLHDVPFAIDWPRMNAILVLGPPAAGQILLEVGVFAAASALAGFTILSPAAVRGLWSRAVVRVRPNGQLELAASYSIAVSRPSGSSSLIPRCARPGAAAQLQSR